MKALNVITRAISFLGLILFAVSFLIPDAHLLGGTGIGLAIASGAFSPEFAYNGKEIADFKELIYEDVFVKSPLNTFFTFIPGIKGGKKIGIVGRMGGLGRSKAACDTTETSVEIPTTEKTWAPCSWGDRIGICVDDVALANFKTWLTKNGLDRADLTNSSYADMMLEQVRDAMLESMYNIAFFGDTDAETVDGSPAGLLTSGTDKELFNCHNGVWKQVFAIVTATPARRVTITKNTGGTYALQAFDSTDTTNRVVTGYFKNLITKSHAKARAKADRIILCTQSMADQYTTELESASGIAPSWEIIQNGITSLKRGGVTILAIPFWDEIILNSFDNGTTLYLPHRALMINKENMVIGCEDEGSLSDFRMFYVEKDKKNYIDFGSVWDTKIIQDIMVQAAY